MGSMSDENVMYAKQASRVKNGMLHSDSTSQWVPIRQHALAEPQHKLRVMTIGAGFSGLTMANKIQHTYKLEDVIDHVVYEKNPKIGGTWLENRYPGVMCDVPAHIYTLLNIPNPNWNNFYATGGEIQEYLENVTKTYQLDKNVTFNAKVVEAIWDEEKGIWNCKIQEQDRVRADWCHVLVNGSGFLNAWNWPNITGLHDFKGDLIHSAAWKDGYQFASKKVAVIGNGSSAIQIVPKIQEEAAELVNYVRTPTYISAPFAEDLSKDPGKNPKYTDAEKEEFRKNPEKHHQYRKSLAHAFNHFYVALIEGSPQNTEARERTVRMMEDRLKDKPELAKSMIPSWSLGCRRLTPGNGYLETLTRPNVSVITESITEITPEGIRTSDGKEEKFDAIVCATGFDVSFQPRWLQLGRGGRSLAEDWSEDAKSYFSICVSGFPNFFMFNGPAGPVGHGSLSSAIDWEADYILKWCQKMAREDIKSINVRQNVQDNWNIWGDELLKGTVWSSGCRSWYKNGRTTGRITALYPGSILHFKDMLQDVRGEDFELDYHTKNQWSFLGDGFTKLEKDGGDLGYYLTC